MKTLKLWKPPIPKLTTSKCQWCTNSVDPYPGFVCGKCHQRLKRLLSSARWLKMRSLRLLTPETAFCADPYNLHSVPFADAKMEVDHIYQWSQHPSLFWEESNHQTLCRNCHQIKTRKDPH